MHFWSKWRDPIVDGELATFGSPLLQAPTTHNQGRLSVASMYTNTSYMANHVRVVVRVRPQDQLVNDSQLDEPCIECNADSLMLTAPAAAGPPNTPGRTPTHVSCMPGSRSTPGGCTTPSGGGRTQRLHTPGRTPMNTIRCPGSAGHMPLSRTPSMVAQDAAIATALAPDRTPGARLGSRALAPPRVPRRFVFDTVCGPDSSQEYLFGQARPLIEASLGGANSCIFAYGQTGSGKTHTMIGTNSCPGVVPRAVDRVWECINASDGTEWQVSLTYVELYNDGFRDLLAESSQPGQRLLPSEIEAVRRSQSCISLRETKSARGLPPTSYTHPPAHPPPAIAVATSTRFALLWLPVLIRKDAECGFPRYLSGSETFRKPVYTKAQLLELLERGHSARAVGVTSHNERSSRSHAVITLNINSRPANATCVRTGKLHLVDLAGSEALSTGVESVLTAETRAINVSLTALCDVLQALSKNARRAPGAAPLPVPYRNHKLTRLLADSLGGNSHTLMVAAVQPSGRYYRSTATTLKFASRARDITTHGASVNNDGELGRSTNKVALHAKIAELTKRLLRREAEIVQLEQMAANHEAGRAVVFAELARVEAERKYELAVGEARAVLAMSDERTLSRRLHLAEDELARAARRGGRAESSMALAQAQRDEACANAMRTTDKLVEMGEGWRFDRTALDAAATQADRLAVEVKRAKAETAAAVAELGGVLGHAAAKECAAVKEASGLASERDTLRAQLESERAVALLGVREMTSVRSVLNVIDMDEVSSRGNKAEETLQWLRLKISEGVDRFDADTRRVGCNLRFSADLTGVSACKPVAPVHVMATFGASRLNRNSSATAATGKAKSLDGKASAASTPAGKNTCLESAPLAIPALASVAKRTGRDLKTRAFLLSERESPPKRTRAPPMVAIPTKVSRVKGGSVNVSNAVTEENLPANLARVSPRKALGQAVGCPLQRDEAPPSGKKRALFNPRNAKSFAQIMSLTNVF